jgi:tetratricopeptide (TPR) repeat protein
MKKIIFLFSLLYSLIGFSQNDQLAINYFDKGEFENALVSFQDLLTAQPGNGFYFQKEIECYQQLKQYDVAEKAILERLKKFNQSYLLVELGANYQLQKDESKAKKNFEQALDKIKKNPSEVYGIAAVFERKVLIDYALQSYEIALEIDPNMNFNFQMAVLYGQKGETDKMIEKFLEESFKNPQNLILIQNQFTRFMTENADVTFNEALRKALLLRIQKNQDIFWNQYLSWYYVQQKEFGKAFIQEKAIYKRNPESLSNIVNLAQISIEEEENETAKGILAFILENSKDTDLQMQAHYFLTEMKINNPGILDYSEIEKDLVSLLNQYGITPYSLKLQILKAHFDTFHMKNPALGKAILIKALELPINEFQKADVKMELADIYLFEEKFNQASLYYSQIEEDLKNDVIGHEATLKSAKTSYFKGDFIWALKQFKELKTVSSQLIANDALEYFLLINDNTVADSTQTALKQFARGDYLIYQSKPQEALLQFQDILKNFKGKEIESVTLYRLGKIYEKIGDYQSALSQYQKIIDQHSEEIYIDEALFFSAEIYNKKLIDLEKAKSYYEKIVFHHQDSIYFVDARKKYRELRGDNKEL